MLSPIYTQFYATLRINLRKIMKSMDKLPESTSLLYSELLQQCAASLPVDKGIVYTCKTVAGNKYWYMQLTVGSVTKQFSLGRDSEELRAKIEAQKKLVEQSKPDVEKHQRLVAMLVKGGAASPSNIEARALEVLERAGVFLAGGVLIGSHAFSVYGNILGVSWSSAAMRTLDMDVAGAKNIPVAVARPDEPLGKVLENAGMGFFEVPAMNKKSASTMYKIQGKEFHVDLLTPMHGAESKKPVYLKNLKTYATPLRFLDYLLTDTTSAVVVAKNGIVVNVPDPSRFAIHKLVVSVRRPTIDHIKSEKDRTQAMQLLDILLVEHPGQVLLALDAAREMPKKFWTDLEKGVSLLPEKFSRRLLL